MITSPYNYEVGQAERIGVDFFGSTPCEVEVRVRKDDYRRNIVASRKKVFGPGQRGMFELVVRNEFLCKVWNQTSTRFFQQDFAREFHHLSCPGQTRTKVA